jgi:hypothetical protein
LSRRNLNLNSLTGKIWTGWYSLGLGKANHSLSFPVFQISNGVVSGYAFDDGLLYEKNGLINITGSANQLNNAILNFSFYNATYKAYNISSTVNYLSWFVSGSG